MDEGEGIAMVGVKYNVGFALKLGENLCLDGLVFDLSKIEVADKNGSLNYRYTFKNVYFVVET